MNENYLVPNREDVLGPPGWRSAMDKTAREMGRFYNPDYYIDRPSTEDFGIGDVNRAEKFHGGDVEEDFRNRTDAAQEYALRSGIPSKYLPEESRVRPTRGRPVSQSSGGPVMRTDRGFIWNGPQRGQAGDVLQNLLDTGYGPGHSLQYNPSDRPGPQAKIISPTGEHVGDMHEWFSANKDAPIYRNLDRGLTPPANGPIPLSRDPGRSPERGNPPASSPNIYKTSPPEHVPNAGAYAEHLRSLIGRRRYAADPTNPAGENTPESTEASDITKGISDATSQAATTPGQPSAKPAASPFAGLSAGGGGQPKGVGTPTTPAPGGAMGGGGGRGFDPSSAGAAIGMGLLNMIPIIGPALAQGVGAGMRGSGGGGGLFGGGGGGLGGGLLGRPPAPPPTPGALNSQTSGADANRGIADALKPPGQQPPGAPKPPVTPAFSALTDKTSRLNGPDRRWITLESAKFVAANTDTLDDSHELATRADHYAAVKTSTFTPERSALIREAFVMTVCDLGRTNRPAPIRRVAMTEPEIDPQAMFL